MEEANETFAKTMPSIMAYDTETNGLHHMVARPFLYAFGFDKYVYLFEPTFELLSSMFAMAAKCDYMFAHNAKFDLHMTTNFGFDIPEDVRLADSTSVARLTEYADSEVGMSLESLGSTYVDKNSKAAQDSIKHHMTLINKAQRNFLKDEFKKMYPKVNFKPVMDAWQKRVPFVKTEYDEYFEFIDELYSPANFHDVYMEKEALMLNYAADDIVIVLEYLKRAMPTLRVTDPGFEIFHQECDLIRVVADMERVGFRMDIDYLLESRQRMIEFQQKLYGRLKEITGKEFSSGQHDVIKKIYETQFGMMLGNADKKTMKKIGESQGSDEAKEMAEIIRRLRTADKWIGTYIDGKLKNMVDGRLYTTINNSGTKTGRVSSDLQQQPKDPFLADEDDETTELFHPRKPFITDEGYTMTFLDYSQMELRVQAFYTILLGEPDFNLCRAYMPFGCVSVDTFEDFDPKNLEHIQRWNSGEWVNEDGSEWIATEVHDETTLHAFAWLTKDHPKFKKYRKWGKMANFLKNYGGGVGAIIEQLDLDEETAKSLDEGYYKAFPKIKNYQKATSKELYRLGYTTNIYGRRYYISDPSFFYKGANYRIQGTCAEIVKQAQLSVAKLLRGKLSKFAMSIHDELVFLLHESELNLAVQIQNIMQDLVKTIPWVPMLCEIEMSQTNWAEKEKI